MIIYCFWYSKSLFPVIPWLPLAPITMPTQFSCSFSCRCLRASSCWLKANVPWEILCIGTSHIYILLFPFLTHPACIAEGPVYCRKIGNVVLTAASEVGVCTTLFHLAEGWAHEKLSQQKLTWIDYLIMKKHNACFFVILMPMIWYWEHTFSAEITA